MTEPTQAGRSPARRPSIRILVPAQTRGGMERMSKAVAASLADRGFMSEIWAPRESPDLPAREERDSHVFRRIGPGGSSLLRMLTTHAAMAATLALERKTYDAVLVYGANWLCVAAGVSARLSRRPWCFRPLVAGEVTSFIGAGKYIGLKDLPVPEESHSWMGRRLNPQWRRARLLQADAVVAQSNEIVEELLGLGFRRDQIHVIPNGVDIDRFARLTGDVRKGERERLRLPADGLVFLFLGRFEPRKGVLQLLHAWKALRDAGSIREGTLVLAGAGVADNDPYAGHVIETVNSLAKSGSNYDIRIAGWVDPAEWLRVSDVFVMPSYLEGFSNSLLEAMASELTIVATDIPPTAEAVPNGSAALLCRVGDREALQSALKRVGEDAALRGRLSAAAKKRAVEVYPQSVIIEKYARLFEELIARRPWR